MSVDGLFRICRFLAVGIEIEPVPILKLIVRLIIIHRVQTFPLMASHGTIVRSSQIIHAGLPCVIAGLTLTLFIDPAVEHLSFLIKRILFRYTVCTDNGLKIHSSGILRFVSFSVSAEIIPYGIRLIVILRIIVFQLSPLAAHHDTTFIDIIVIVIVLYQLADCHLSVFIQPEPVIAGFFPG